MTTFDDRERAFESQYARDQEMQFKIVARQIDDLYPSVGNPFADQGLDLFGGHRHGSINPALQ